MRLSDPVGKHHVMAGTARHSHELSLEQGQAIAEPSPLGAPHCFKWGAIFVDAGHQ